MGVGDVEAGSWRLAEREAVDWRKIEDGQGKVGGLVVAPCPWRPHPPRIPRPVPVGTRWHAARAGPDTFDKRRRNGKQRAARDLERTSLLVVTRHPTDTFVSTIYAATQITRVSHTSIIIPSGSFHDLSEEWWARSRRGSWAAEKGKTGARRNSKRKFFSLLYPLFSSQLRPCYVAI